MFPYQCQTDSLTDASRPVEMQQIHIRPADFFTSSPALDVPSAKNKASVLLSCCGNKGEADGKTQVAHTQTPVQEEATSHLQGSGPDIDAEIAGATVG